jgi:copper chaperone CopZ
MDLTLAVDGMHCANCANLVIRTLAALPEAPQVSVDLEARRVRLQGEGPAPDLERLHGILDEIGFSLRGPVEP